MIYNKFSEICKENNGTRLKKKKSLRDDSAMHLEGIILEDE